MPLRDAPTPTPAQLDALADARPGDETEQRAREQWRRGQPTAMRALLDATTDGNVGNATGPVTV